MAVNTNKRHSSGAEKQRSQIFNVSTGHYVLKDNETGKFLRVKRDGKPFKGVRLETSEINYQKNPSVKKSTAIRAERAVLKVLGMK